MLSSSDSMFNMNNFGIGRISPEDTEEFIEMLGGKVTKRIIYNWIREKKIPAFKVGNRYVFSRKRVDEFIAKKLGIAS